MLEDADDEKSEKKIGKNSFMKKTTIFPHKQSPKAISYVFGTPATGTWPIAK